MDIKDGELTVLIGPSGCGKTTTLKMINRLLPVSKGEIFIDGKNIEEIDKVELRRNMVRFFIPDISRRSNAAGHICSFNVYTEVFLQIPLSAGRGIRNDVRRQDTQS